MEVEKKAIDDIVKRPHKVILENREKLNVTGIGKVYNANEHMISMEINGTNLVVEGSNMEVSKLDVQAGTIEVLGIINELKYASSGAKSAKTFLNRIFK